jgi:hypothetical protein
MSHTPGPWEAAESYGRGDDEQVMIHGAKIGAMRQCIAITCRRSRHEEQYRITADARLIAAAPEMLEALEAAHRELLTVLDSINREVVHHDGDEFHERLQRIEAAIAKAKGES